MRVVIFSPFALQVLILAANRRGRISRKWDPFLKKRVDVRCGFLRGFVPK